MKIKGLALFILFNLGGCHFALASVESDWKIQWEKASLLDKNQLISNLSASQWHQRASALLHLKKKYPNEAIKNARTLVKDSSLMVRSYVFDILLTSEDKEDKNLLKEALYDKINFHKGVSLFVRRQIIRGLDPKDLLEDKELMNKLNYDTDVVIANFSKQLQKTKLE